MSDRLKEIVERSEKADLPTGEIEPLGSKCYGTNVRFPSVGTIEVWFGCGPGADETPSVREVAIRGDRYPADNHYEDAYDLACAEFFANAPSDIRYLLDLLRQTRYDESQRASVQICGLNPAQIQELILFAKSYGWRHPGDTP